MDRIKIKKDIKTKALALIVSEMSLNTVYYRHLDVIERIRELTHKTLYYKVVGQLHCCEVTQLLNSFDMNLPQH